MANRDDEQRQRDIADVIREEIARRRPIDMEDIRTRLQERSDILAVIRGRDEKEFRRVLSDYFEPDAPEFEQLVAVWRALRRPSGAAPPGV
jgi:hypothetical protein